jgi:hypothetical protein
MNTDWVGRIVSRIGEAALVMVDQRARNLTLDARSLTPKKPAEPKAKPEAVRIKYASAHDLRRAFGLRWSSRVMPAVLQQLMRHESIEKGPAEEPPIEPPAKSNEAAQNPAQSVSAGARTERTTEHRPNGNPREKRGYAMGCGSVNISSVAREGLEPPTKGL